MADRRGPKGPRNKFKRNLMIEGHPEELFRERKHTYYSISFDGKTVLLGKIGPKAIELLKEIPGIQVIEEQKKGYSPIRMPHVQSIRKVGNNTAIVVAAPDEEKLRDYVITVKAQVARRGIDVEVTERCQWRCEVDPGETGNNGHTVTDAVEAMVKLGYKRTPSRALIDRIALTMPAATAEELVKAALGKTTPALKPEMHAESVVHESPVTQGEKVMSRKTRELNDIAKTLGKT